MPKHHFFYRKDGLLKKLNPETIIFLEAANNYTKFYTADKEQYIRVSLDTAMNLLPENTFLRIHRSFAVSADHIDEVRRDSVTLINIPDIELPVSKQHYPGLLKKIVILESASPDTIDKPE